MVTWYHDCSVYHAFVTLQSNISTEMHLSWNENESLYKQQDGPYLSMITMELKNINRIE